MVITLTKKQEQGLKIAVERYRLGEKYTTIAGFAGSGKTTLIQFIISALNVDPEEEVAYVAYTGKASTVLQSKGCPNATTAHKLLFKARPLPNGTYKFFPKSILDKDFKVVVVDEISMLPMTLWQQLLRHPVYILACGDPGQLPPVSKNEDNHVLDNPHIFLDEIMRQAQDSEIIRLSQHIRQGGELSTFQCLGEQVQILNKEDVVTGMYEWADQIICATNQQRNNINNIVRAQKGFQAEPCVGDKIISLKNHWDILSSNQEWALTNGTIGTIEDYDKRDIKVPKYIHDKPIPYMFTTISLEDNSSFIALPIDYQALTTGTPCLSDREAYLLNKNILTLDAPFNFTYAYGITTWKAQGSEWPKVLGFEEAFPFDPETRMKEMYTLATRASEKLVIIKK